MASVCISETASGFLPTLWWGEGTELDRVAYEMAFADLEAAEKAGRAWAEREDATYVPYVAVDPDARKREIALIKQLREDHGLTLPEAIAQARRKIAEGDVRAAAAA